MTRLIGLMVAAAAAFAPAAAQAADWWWVAGEPGGRDAWFVDSDSISGGVQRSFHMIRVASDRSGAAEEAGRVDCDRSSSDAVQRFVCATPEQRMSLGAMLGPISPETAAAAIFAAPPVETANR